MNSATQFDSDAQSNPPQCASSFKHLEAAVSHVDVVPGSARIVRSDKRGATPAHLSSILQRLGLDSASFLSKMQAHAFKRGYVVGQISRLKNFAEYLQLQRRVGVGLPAEMPPWAGELFLSGRIILRII